jgi:hypothetical protein
VKKARWVPWKVTNLGEQESRKGGKKWSGKSFMRTWKGQMLVIGWLVHKRRHRTMNYVVWIVKASSKEDLESLQSKLKMHRHLNFQKHQRDLLHRHKFQRHPTL